MQAADLSGHRVLTLELEGRAESYRVMFFSGEPGAQPTWRDVDGAGRVHIELDDVPGLDLAQLRAIGIFVSGAPGEFEFAVREARLH